MKYQFNMAVVSYFGTQIPEVEKIDGHIQIETTDIHEKDMNDPKDQFKISDVLNPVLLTVKDLQVESYEDEEVLIEYILTNPIPFKEVVECVVNDEKVHLTKEELDCQTPELKIGLHNKING